VALNVVLLQTALRLELRDKPTLRGHRKLVVRDPSQPFRSQICCDAQPRLCASQGVIGIDRNTPKIIELAISVG
jgi:hypothetical protein